MDYTINVREKITILHISGISKNYSVRWRQDFNPRSPTLAYAIINYRLLQKLKLLENCEFLII